TRRPRPTRPRRTPTRPRATRNRRRTPTPWPTATARPASTGDSCAPPPNAAPTARAPRRDCPRSTTRSGPPAGPGSRAPTASASTAPPTRSPAEARPTPGTTGRPRPRSTRPARNPAAPLPPAPRTAPALPGCPGPTTPARPASAAPATPAHRRSPTAADWSPAPAPAARPPAAPPPADRPPAPGTRNRPAPAAAARPPTARPAVLPWTRPTARAPAGRPAPEPPPRTGLPTGPRPGRTAAHHGPPERPTATCPPPRPRSGSPTGTSTAAASLPPTPPDDRRNWSTPRAAHLPVGLSSRPPAFRFRWKAQCIPAPAERPATDGATTWSVGATAPPDQRDEQLLLPLPPPRHAAVRPQQHGGHLQLRPAVDDAVDPVLPPRDRKPPGPVEQQPATAAQPLVQAPPPQPHVPHPPAEQLVPRTEVVADPEPGDLLDQVPVHHVEVHQLRQQPAHRPGTRSSGHQLALRADVVQHLRGHRAPLVLVAVQQPRGRPAAHLRGQFPTEVERVLDTEVEALPAQRRVHVRRVAGQQHPADPVALGEPDGVPEPGQPARGVHAEIRARVRPQLLLDLRQLRRHRAVGAHPRRGHHDAVQPVPGRPDPEPLVDLAHFGHHAGDRLRLLGRLHLAQQPLVPGRFPGEVDAEQLAHRAAPAVAPDEVAGPQPSTVGELDGHPVLVLPEPDQRATAPELGTDHDSALGQQAIGDGLRNAEHVGVRRVQPGGLRLGDA